MPYFSNVNHLVRLSSDKNIEIDLLGAAGPEAWVCQNKWVENKKIGINELKLNFFPLPVHTPLTALD